MSCIDLIGGAPYLVRELAVPWRIFIHKSASSYVTKPKVAYAMATLAMLVMLKIPFVRISSLAFMCAKNFF